MWSGLCTSASEAPRLSSAAGNDNFFDDMLAPSTTTAATTSKLSRTEESDNSLSNQTQPEEPAKAIEKHDVTEDDDWGVDGWESPKPKFANPPPPPLQPSVSAPRNPRLVALEAAVLEELQHYILDFADPRATEELNGDLNDAKGFARHVAYYTARPELAQYTIEQEVPRMEYRVTTSDGVVLPPSSGAGGDPEATARVARCFRDVIDESSNLSAMASVGIKDDGLRSTTPEVPFEILLVRMANQSLWGDMTAALSEYLIRPELLTSVVVSACTFDLDFAAGTLLADAVFQVSTVTSASAAGQSSSSSSGSKNGPQNKGQRAGSRSSGSCERLELGSLKGRVSICLPARDIEFSFARPNLKVVLDGELQRAAAVVAELRGFDDHESEGEEVEQRQQQPETAAASREAPVMDNRAEHEASTAASSVSMASSTPLPVPGGGLFRGLSNLVGEAWRPEPTPCLYNRDAAASPSEGD